MANDLWRTPPSVIDYVKKRWGKIGVDLCASKENAVASNYFSESDSMLNISKSDLKFVGGLLWCNPPYSNPLPFTKKCAELASECTTVIMLLNLDTSTKWFDVIDKHATGIYPITGGRVSFCNEHGEPIKGNNKPQVLVKFGGYSKQKWETIPRKDLQC